MLCCELLLLTPAMMVNAPGVTVEVALVLLWMAHLLCESSMARTA